MISTYTANKIHIISIFAIICVVLGHSGCGETKIQSYLIPIFCQWHVPWFFIVSGYFLLSSLEKYNGHIAVKKAKTLLLPYVLWAIIGGVTSSVSKIEAVTALKILGISTVFPQFNPNLWYLRELIVYTFGTIILHRLLRNNGKLTLVMFICCFVMLEFCKMTIIYGVPTAPLYFSLGFLLAAFKVNINVKISVLIGVVVIVAAIISRVVWFIVGPSSNTEMLLRMICVCLEIVAIWSVYDIIAAKRFVDKRCNPFPIFFVYCVHGPILIFLKKFWYCVIGASQNDIVSNTGWICMCVGTITSSCAIANLMRNTFHRTYKLLTGNRS